MSTTHAITTTLLAIALTGCWPSVQPTGTDPAVRHQQWATEEAYRQCRLQQEQQLFECDPLTWPNTARLAEQHPGCLCRATPLPQECRPRDPIQCRVTGD